jgi:uncharacterized protein YbbK (DUF523 family)
MKKSEKLLVSACLAGEACRYDCQAKPNTKIIELVKSGHAISLCPEQLGGLPTPRPAAEIQSHNSVLTIDKEDVTDAYKLGADEAWNLVKDYSIKKAYLKSKSPMCGFGKVYDGSFSGKLIQGNGIFAALLLKLGIEIESIE